MTSSTTIALRVRELAERFKVREQQILTWIDRGDLAAVDVSSRPGVGRPTWRILESAVVDFTSRRSSKKPAKQLRRRRKKQAPDFVTYF